MKYFNPHCKNPKRRSHRNKAKQNELHVRQAKKLEKLKRENPEIAEFDLLSASSDFPKFTKSKIAKIESYKKRKFEKLKNSNFQITLSGIPGTAKGQKR